MLFNSQDFLIFLVLITLAYFIVPRKHRIITLLIASYVFYMGWNPKYVVLLAASTIITWISGILIHQSKQRKKTIVALCFIANLSILIVFKYFYFLLDNVNVVLGGVFHAAPIEMPYNILLPVGISFYIFQALGYIIDVYRGTTQPERNIIRYGLFVSFFPQLVAGPIERSSNLISQIKDLETEKHDFDIASVKSGLIYMLWGFFMKLVIADRAAVLVNTVYDTYWRYGAFELLTATILFSIQIYCDFAAYSSIAIGVAKIFRIDLMENFNAPYLAVSIRDFWRRWHISLSTWFRDYLYIPLGGNRTTKWKSYRNTLIVFLVSGLWHGTSWTFVIWGLLHGIYLVLEGILAPLKKQLNKRLDIDENNFGHVFSEILFTYVLTTFAWIFFRADTFEVAIGIIKNIFTDFDVWVLFDGTLFTLGLPQLEIWILSISLVLLCFVDILKWKYKLQLDSFLARQNRPFRWVVLIGLICFIIIFGYYGPTYDTQEFIYFQF